MFALLSADEQVAFTGLPARAACKATESDTAGAQSTTSVATAGDADPVEGDDTVALELAADGDDDQPVNTIAFTNTFEVGAVTITKTVTGEGAETYGSGPFFVRLTCVDGDGVSVFEQDYRLGDDRPLTVTATDVFVPSTCTVTEPQNGGATSSSISPEGAFPVTGASAETPVAVTVTNTFDVGAVRLVKVIDGNAADLVTDDETFVVQVSCTRVVNEATVPVALPAGGVVTLSKGTGLEATVDGLPVGAACTVTETDDGDADITSVEPGEVTVAAGEPVEVRIVNTFLIPSPPVPSQSGSTPPGPSASGSSATTTPPTDDPTDPGSVGGGGGSGGLPDTGGPGVWIPLLGLGLLGAGVGLLASRRRPSRGRHAA